MIFDATRLSPVLLELGPVVIRWYSIAYILGFVFGYKYCLNLIKNRDYGINKKHLEDLLVWLVVGVILGGRLGYAMFYNFSYYIDNPIDVLKVWQGGMSFHGGALGSIIAAYLFARKNQIKFLNITDLICVSVPLGLLFGRLANFINNELWGKFTNGSWGVIFKDGSGLPRHPSQLYEAFLEGLILLILLNLLYRYKSNKAGVVSGAFLMLYGIFRIIVEFFREPDYQIGYILNNFTMGQILSLPMIAIGIYLMLRVRNK